MSSKKTIMVDGRNLGLEKGTGVSTYARNLSHCLHEMGYGVDVLYGNRAAPGMSDLMKEITFFDDNLRKTPAVLRVLNTAKDLFRTPFGFNATRVPITGKVISDTFKSRLPYFDHIENSPNIFTKAHNVFGVFKQLNKIYPEQKPDLMHWTYPLALRVPGVPNIYTLHDLVPLRLPYTTLDNKRRYFRLVSAIARRADHIVTVSETSKRDIMELLGVPEERITNTYQSVHIPEKYVDKPEEVVQREIEGTFGLGYKNYYLFWGSIEPKKNIGRMIEGYLASGVEAPLVVVGAQAWKSEEELKLLNEGAMRDRGGSETSIKRKVIRLSYVPFPLLVSLIRGAKATVFPSLYEGFGLPVLESMLLGTPVIAANTASLPEIAGESAILINPYDSQEIARAIRVLDVDDTIREGYASAGRIQGLKFSKEAYCERLSSIYKRFI
ncbi:MAG TPA: glycosyltransferase family 1 protein [Pseudomonadales bacterium]|nr:glycosyltransferase family 1 protein [Anaerolineales bacterium]HND28277.1 glycosyltransferase family 1 protein [Pseudomonadales bacterium]